MHDVGNFGRGGLESGGGVVIIMDPDWVCGSHHWLTPRSHAAFSPCQFASALYFAV